jgi:hypothetical protein
VFTTGALPSHPSGPSASERRYTYPRRWRRLRRRVERVCADPLPPVGCRSSTRAANRCSTEDQLAGVERLGGAGAPGRSPNRAVVGASVIAISRYTPGHSRNPGAVPAGAGGSLAPGAPAEVRPPHLGGAWLAPLSRPQSGHYRTDKTRPIGAECSTSERPEPARS